MRWITRVLIVLCALLIAVPSQSAAGVSASTSACPAGGCSVYLPLTRTAGKLLTVGLVTDVNGINDKSFNQSAWQGVLNAQANLGASGAYLESESEYDYATNINQFISQGTDLIITVGYLLSDVTKAAAQGNPDQKFSIVDVAYDPIIPNILSQTYASEQAAFLSAYLAAGMTTTGIVATFGGMNIPTVTRFMNGYHQGVSYYNQEHGASIQVLGWDPDTQTGEFTNDFNDPAAGKAMGEKLLGLGADILFPVAGPTGLGAAQAVQEQGDAWVIGVDTDWTLTAPEYASIVLTSALKNPRATTYEAIKLAYQDRFVGGELLGTLANEGVGLGTIAASVPPELLTKVEQVKAAIIAGEIIVIP